MVVVEEEGRGLEGRAKAEGLGRWVSSVGCVAVLSSEAETEEVSEPEWFWDLGGFLDAIERAGVVVVVDAFRLLAVVVVLSASVAARTSFSIWYRSLPSRGLTPFSR